MDQLLQALNSVTSQYSEPPAEPVKEEPKHQRQTCPTVIIGRCYALNRSETKFVSVGLNSHLAFTPVVLIRSSQKNYWVLLREDEWAALLATENIIRYRLAELKTTVKSEYKSSSHWQLINLGSTTVDCHMYEGTPVVTLRTVDDGRVCLGEDSLQELWSLANLINYRIDILKSLEFGKWYNTLINGAAQSPQDFKRLFEETIAQVRVTNSENNLAILELLKYAPHIINCDIVMARVALGPQ